MGLAAKRLAVEQVSIADIDSGKKLSRFLVHIAQIYSCKYHKVLYNDSQQGHSFLKFHGLAMTQHSDSLVVILVSGLVVVLVDDLGLCPVGEETGAR